MRPRLMQSLKNAVISLTVFIFFGCAKTIDPLNNTTWILQSLYSQHPVEGTTIILRFAKGYAGGNSGCNEYFGGENLAKKYSVSSDGNLRIDFANTLLPCLSPEGTKQEEDYFKALRKVTGYQLTESRLDLTDETGTIILVFTK